MIDGSSVNLLWCLLTYRQKPVEKDLWHWNYNGRNFYASNTQFVSFYREYLQGKFDEIYTHDWNQKTVMDLGGFIGDSALYFLDNGALKRLRFMNL